MLYAHEPTPAALRLQTAPSPSRAHTACASLLLRRRPSFSLCVEAAVVCVAVGRRHEIRRQDRHPAPLLWLSGDSGFLLIFVVDRNKQDRCFTRASPPVASGRLRSPPVASGRLRSPPVDLARHAPARWRWARGWFRWCLGGSRWVVGHCFSARARFGD